MPGKKNINWLKATKIKKSYKTLNTILKMYDDDSIEDEEIEYTKTITFTAHSIHTHSV